MKVPKEPKPNPSQLVVGPDGRLKYKGFDVEWVQQELAARMEAERDYHAFVQQAWAQIEGVRPFVDGWHLQAKCEHIQAVLRGEIKNLLINEPPRASKSLTFSVCLVPFAWIAQPDLRFVYASHDEKLTIRDSLKARQLMMGKWYQARHGKKFQILDGGGRQDYFSNDKGGARISVGIKGNITGEGGDIIVCLPPDMLLATDAGWLPIGEIVENKLRVRVLSYDHVADEMVWDDIVAYEKNPGRPLVEIELTDGSCLRCTEDHQVWVNGRGYIRADAVRAGDEVTVVPGLRQDV